ncbi:MAG: hypothetical protein ACK4FL_02225 [Microgenomates group bacterium]
MSPKPGFWEDILEQLEELGATTGKKAAQSAAQTFSPLKIAEKIVNPQSSSPSQSPEKPQSGKNNHTPLNFEKLQKEYQKQDEQKAAAVRQRLFQLVKTGEEKVLMEKKQKEAEKQKRLIYEEQEKKKKEEERKRQEQLSEIPQGKIRRSIFSPKKVAQRQHAEVKPASGKQ